MESCLENPIFQIASEYSGKSGCPLYVIGGYVRDYFLQRPSKDIDILVVGDVGRAVKSIADEIRRRFSMKVFVTQYGRFHTAMLKYGSQTIEFVGARKESYDRDSRNPKVTDGTLEDDQLRRDFTINVLAFDLRPDHFGELVDPFGGMDDLDDEIIRTPTDPDITFSDDPLRMMRAVRFASQLNFSIYDETFEAIVSNRERIRIVSPERIADELNKIMLSPLPSIGLRLLERSGLLRILIPEVQALTSNEVVEGRHHKNNFDHSLKVLDNVSHKSKSLYLRWAALLHDIGKATVKKYSPSQGWTFHGHEAVGEKMVKAVFKRLTLPLDEMKYVAKLVGLHMRPIALAQDGVTDSAVRRLLFEAGDDVDDLMTLCEADITSRNEAKVRLYLDNFQIVREKFKEIEAKDALRNFQNPIGGEEIMRLFNIPPCSTIGILKEAVKEAILDGVIGNNHEEALPFLLKKASQMGLKSVE